ncbi:uncharacterized protein LOC111697967 isoform X2 [Eurytemora carolleeae]|uniref:uncharacterized protein LOC111697967 isoform X2 n=1 Tax=Eurytemora carolleeae TaxID=1294199 RepID=UPI000C792865|nr:uncharacterized protein LOC111697967 isoform X2 [Eurytemora carolleeae]|eukprot:XP_023323925.1 uncharacterized protein LOC111697967 isoform X2 [Eurytemora affinis]
MEILKSILELGLMLVVINLGRAEGQLNIDLSTAQLDPDTGNYCVLQKVCIANPPEGLTSSGCAPQYPPGCDCDPDPSAVNADESCQAGFKCVQCKCLPPGCNCDPNSPDPDGFCPAGEICKGCVCGPALPPGCECDPDLPDADTACPPQERCVGCLCQNCPQSDTSSKVLNPPLVFVIDTTKSVKPDKDSIFNLTMKVVNTIRKDRINIPRYQLVSFNDFGPPINLNVKIEADTPNVTEFEYAARSLKFESYNGGRDSKERLTQGLLVALQNATPKSLIVVFTDNGSKDLNLEKEIIRLREEMECTIYIVLTPVYEGKPGDKSLPAYGRMGQVFLISEVGAESFLANVQDFEEKNCL